MRKATATTADEKNKRVVLNIISGLSYQIAIAVFGLIIPRLYLVSFGSDVNGLNSTIKNILLTWLYLRRELVCLRSMRSMDLSRREKRMISMRFCRRRDGFI